MPILDSFFIKIFNKVDSKIEFLGSSLTEKDLTEMFLKKIFKKKKRLGRFGLSFKKLFFCFTFPVSQMVPSFVFMHKSVFLFALILLFVLLGLFALRSRALLPDGFGRARDL